MPEFFPFPFPLSYDKIKTWDIISSKQEMQRASNMGSTIVNSFNDGEYIMTLTVEKIKDIITPICKQYHITAAYLFGSYARGDFTPSSDVDIRIDCSKSDKLKGLFGVSGLRLDLEDALKKPVDLLTWIPLGENSKEFRENMLRDEVLIYGARKS